MKCLSLHSAFSLITPASERVREMKRPALIKTITDRSLHSLFNIALSSTVVDETRRSGLNMR